MVFPCWLCAGCYHLLTSIPPRISLPRDPSSVDAVRHSEIVRHLCCVINDGGGRTKKTPWGENYFEYYLRVLRTERTNPEKDPAIYSLGSCAFLYGTKYTHTAEAFVQEGYGEEACRAVVEVVRSWRDLSKAGRTIDPASVALAYLRAVELKFRMDLHENRELAKRLSPEDPMLIRDYGKGFHLLRVDGEVVHRSLAPKLRASGDGLFEEAYEGMLAATREWEKQEGTEVTLFH